MKLSVWKCGYVGCSSPCDLSVRGCVCLGCSLDALFEALSQQMEKMGCAHISGCCVRELVVT